MIFMLFGILVRMSNFSFMFIQILLQVVSVLMVVIKDVIGVGVLFREVISFSLGLDSVNVYIGFLG